LEKSVSVIIPVFNASDAVQEVLEALQEQTYDGDCIEIIIVDNGSTDDTAEMVQKYPVSFLRETETRSPYAARNAGLIKASGEIIALVDANKIPEKTWIEEGVKALLSENAHLAAGDIQFRLVDEPTTAEIYDAISFNDNRKFVTEENGAATGNLFFKKEILEKTGLFPAEFRSGMDIWWTQNAARNGFKLVFAENAKVWCKPRKLKQILKKSYRVGKSHPFIQKQAGRSAGYILAMIFRTFMPPKMKPLKEKILQIKAGSTLFRVWCVAWAAKIFMGFGRIHGLIFMNSEISS
jgi:glycosyltransferase involved in cell wall biosynthesis